ncbi:energy transducer TonB [Prosthecobacter dejongeii]|uniref:TonB family protein n=1 Tax=Prosthecobacter dejongeii TaxID=48465 RepID=A0A7W7YJD6_9BACT|nr:energy transducer TonB [Prosthecobacter dejongeii]MBB5037179.1 TonB family protein [Prosthecobacter dejongeii]
MKQAVVGLLAALGLHAIVFLFGGFLIPKGEEGVKKKEVLVEVEVNKKEEKKVEEEPKEKLEEPVPDIEQDMKDFRELAAPAASAPGPALSAASLSDLSSALSGAGGGEGGFGSSVGFGSGVIGGSGSGSMGGMGDMLSGGQLDNKPEPVNRASPKLSSSQRQKAKGVVNLIIVVGPDGTVSKADVTDTPDPSINAPCIEAARQWRFKPGTRAGKPVSFKLKLPFRFE